MNRLSSSAGKYLVIGLMALIALGVAASISYMGGTAEKKPVATPVGLKELSGINQAFVQVAQAAKPAVVNISTTTVIKEREGQPSPFLSDPFFRRFFGEEFFRQFQMPRERRLQALGSGVIVDQGGYIVTNNHMVEGTTEIKVVLDDKREFIGKIVGRDPKTDLAVIRINAKDLPTIPWGDSDKLQVGEWVLAFGNPFGLTSTVTSGIISAVGRANVGIADYEDFIQTDAPINPGNSGGALVNLKGELIGINTAIFSQSGGSMGIGFAIPSNMVRAVMQSLIKTGKVVRGYIGLEIQTMTPELAKQFGVREPKGALVAGVVKDGPAEKAGLQQGDVIIEFDGKAITDASHFRNQVAATKVGQRVNLKLLRKGETLTRLLTIEERPEKMALGTGNALAGLEVADIDSRLRQEYGIPRSVTGVIITQVSPGSSAGAAGLRPGDVIQQINRQPVRNVREFDKISSGLARDSEALLLVSRNGSSGYVVVSPS